jgi:hypothetical protein
MKSLPAEDFRRLLGTMPDQQQVEQQVELLKELGAPDPGRQEFLTHRRTLETDLTTFCQDLWPVIEPAKPLVWGRYLPDRRHTGTSVSSATPRRRRRSGLW